MIVSPARVLIVEDAEEVRDLLVILLERAGYEASACADEETAMAISRRDHPDLVLTDLMLGATSGLDLITRVRSDLAPPVPPIIVCSGFANFEREALQRGAAAFIAKPFDGETILKTVAAVLAHRAQATRDRDDAAARSRALRARAVAAAKTTIARLAPRMPDMMARARRTTDFLPRYFGFGQAFAALLIGDELQVRTSSNEEIWRPGQAIDLGLCRDLMETRSPLLVPDLLSLGTAVRDPSGRVLRFFAGFPLSTGPVSVGALCFLDAAAHHFAADGYAVLEAFGSRYSALLSARETELGPLWTESGCMTREGLCVLLAAELARLRREPLSIALFMFEGRSAALPLGERAAVAELSAGRYAALLTRDRGASRQPLVDVVGAATRAEGFVAGGLVEIEDTAAAWLDVPGILRTAEGLLVTALRDGDGKIERIVVRRDPEQSETSTKPTL